ncbi:hypothetical protein PoB_004498600 [Plakobranchus ocellatus]|uniref:Uncharacterized protein n=1 Tax=Plakobranchus ocellatus TaxID=259542 RepID=A0AAV4BHX7_9GAST|nr:hypothetical protein PoB_004498600 [Plakobranchus ocellatus]
MTVLYPSGTCVSVNNRQVADGKTNLQPAFTLNVYHSEPPTANIQSMYRASPQFKHSPSGSEISSQTLLNRSPQTDDPRLLGPPPGQGASGRARTPDRRVNEMNNLSAVGHWMKSGNS